ncbi:MAG: M20 family peptidase [Deltaproteobacteria bacterium]|nr:M20 family peptidase [Deltaproteobacteria bacterium]MBW2389452.1 M20 family peptidase [Deltaproteobacteria bacterium]
MKTGLRFGIALILVLAAILVVRTLGFESRQLSVEAFDAPDVDANAVAQRLARGLRHRTISHSVDGPVEAQAFLDLHAGLQADYPRTHAKLAREIVSDYSLLYTWKGTRPDLPAVLLLAHQDVVPVEPGSEGSWEHPPYAGDIDETYVWGRGTIDDKGALFCIMEAVEGLVSKGFQPERTVLLAFGHDEELGGPKGATQIAALLAERGVKAEYVLDEGGAVTVGTISIVPDPVAVVGIAEKGYVSIELSIETMGGHSSMPPRQTGIGILAAAIVRLEQNPVPGGIGGAVDIMFDHLGPELDFPIKLVMANRWLFNPLLERAFSGEPTLDAMQRTTTAATIFNGGVKPNVLPSRVKATVNFRILPGDTVDSVYEHVKRTIDDERVQLTIAKESRNPSSISPIDSDGFRALQHTISGFFPDAIVTPYLVVGGTDSRYYSEISSNLYRFAPLRFSAEDRKRMHGTNERIEIAALGRAVAFYTRLIEVTAGP